MREKRLRALRELWRIRAETGTAFDEISPEEQLEYFRRGAEEAIAALERQRERKQRISRALGRKKKTAPRQRL